MKYKVSHTVQVLACLALVLTMTLVQHILDIKVLGNIAWIFTGILFIIHPTTSQPIAKKYGNKNAIIISRVSGLIIILIAMGI